MKNIPEYLKGDLMDGFHWTDIDGVTSHEIVMLDNMAKSQGYQLDILILIRFWILLSYSWDAQFLIINWDMKETFGKFIGNWIKENSEL